MHFLFPVQFSLGTSNLTKQPQLTFWQKAQTKRMRSCRSHSYGESLDIRPDGTKPTESRNIRTASF